MTLHFLITACEPSADAIGADIIHALRTHTQQPLSFSGCGGPLMQAQGLSTLIPFHDAAKFGFGDIIWPLQYLKNIPLLRKFRNQLRSHIQQNPPHAVIALDAPGFALANAKIIRSQRPHVPQILINPPPVWAWRKKRAKIFAQHFNLILTLLPFEPPYFQQYNASSLFIGFPAAQPQIPPKHNVQEFARLHLISDSDIPIAYLPGSRTQEIQRLLPIFGKTHQILSTLMPNLKLKPFIVTPPHLIPLVQKLCPHAFPLHTPIIPSTQRHLLFARSHAALTASGTASLELSVAKIPTVIAYTLHPIIGLAASLLAPLFIHTSHVGILNILAIHLHKQPPIPEFIQQQCSPKKLARALKILIEEPSSQISQTQKLIPHLLKNQNQPATVAAQHILPLIPTTQKHTP